MTKTQHSLERLKEGNRRFVDGASIETHRTHKDIDDQRPFAIVLGCSDSRVPPEIVFDQGVGDLFVIRVAGNIVGPTELAGIEFAAQKFGSRLVVVLGHTCCGAVQATVEAVNGAPSKEAVLQSPDLSEGLKSIVEFISNSVETDTDSPLDQQVQETVESNVRHGVEQIKAGSSAIEELIADEGMEVVGGVYNLKTGQVDFFDT
jgi:carbonic anhydrase